EARVRDQRVALRRLEEDRPDDGGPVGEPGWQLSGGDPRRPDLAVRTGSRRRYGRPDRGGRYRHEAGDQPCSGFIEGLAGLGEYLLLLLIDVELELVERVLRHDADGARQRPFYRQSGRSGTK